jgi:hypothetical protein
VTVLHDDSGRNERALTRAEQAENAATRAAEDTDEPADPNTAASDDGR